MRPKGLAVAQATHKKRMASNERFSLLEISNLELSIMIPSVVYMIRPFQSIYTYYKVCSDKRGLPKTLLPRVENLLTI